MALTGTKLPDLRPDLLSNSGSHLRTDARTLSAPHTCAYTITYFTSPLKSADDAGSNFRPNSNSIADDKTWLLLAT